MNLSYLAYNLVVSGLFGSILPPALVVRWAREDQRDFIDQRLGLTCDPNLAAAGGPGPRIWIHAVSVGEVSVAQVLAEALKQCLPGCRLVLSTATSQGQKVARHRMAGELDCFVAPLDFIPALLRVMKALRPHILVCLETELWPNMFALASRLGVKIAVVNGRLSPRSMRRYRLVPGLMHSVLDHVDLFSMISDADAARITSIGAPAARIAVNGNAKFDVRLPRKSRNLADTIRQQYCIGDHDRVLVAGSTRQGEEKAVLDAYKSVRGSCGLTLLVLAPRHVERAVQVARWVEERQLDFQFHSSIENGRRRTASVVIVDTVGDLFNIYSLATVVFCGGSLVPLGGQNVLEPAAWGKPVLFGPYMDDFRQAKDMLETCGGAKTVKTTDDLRAELACLFRNPELARKMGRAAQGILETHQGAAMRHARAIKCLWQGRSPGV